jgi:hypothetical protein
MPRGGLDAARQDRPRGTTEQPPTGASCVRNILEISGNAVDTRGTAEYGSRVAPEEELKLLDGVCPFLENSTAC